MELQSNIDHNKWNGKPKGGMEAMRDTVREEKKDIIEQIAELGKADRNMLDVAKAYLEGLSLSSA